MLKIIISGCNGHMGRVVESLCNSDPQVEVVAGFDIMGSNDHPYPVCTAPTQFTGSADAVIDFSQITPELIAYLRKFNPYGPGNQKPVFWTKNVFDFGTSKLVGKNLEHIKLELEDNSTSRVINAIAFNMAKYFEHIHAHKPIDICYTIEHNKQANRGDSVQLMIKDIRLSEQ